MDNISDMTRELKHRESARPHLRGIPARRNANAIATLYDRLCAAHITRIETFASFDRNGNDCTMTVPE